MAKTRKSPYKKKKGVRTGGKKRGRPRKYKPSLRPYVGGKLIAAGAKRKKKMGRRKKRRYGPPPPKKAVGRPYRADIHGVSETEFWTGHGAKPGVGPGVSDIREYEPTSPREKYSDMDQFRLRDEINDTLAKDLEDWEFATTVAKVDGNGKVAFNATWNVTFLFSKVGEEYTKIMASKDWHDYGGSPKMVERAISRFADMHTTGRGRMPWSKHSSAKVLQKYVLSVAEKHADAEWKKRGFGARRILEMSEEDVNRETQYYSEILGNSFGRLSQLTEEAVRVAWMMSACVETVTKREVLQRISLVMAEFIEDGMKSRLMAAGMSGTNLYNSIKVFPLIIFEETKVPQIVGKESTLVDEVQNVQVGVRIVMNHYGMYVDSGRGPSTKKDGNWTDFHDSPFYKSLWEWAVDNFDVSVDEKGFGEYKVVQRQSNKKTKLRRMVSNQRNESASGYSQKGVQRSLFDLSEPPIYLPPVKSITTRPEHEVTDLKTKDIESKWMAAIRGDERRITPKGKFWRDAPTERHKRRGIKGKGGMPEVQGTSARRIRASRRGDKEETSETKGRLSFDEMVARLYFKLNASGYDGNHFLHLTLLELNKKGILEYYFSAFIKDVSKAPKTDNPWHKYKATITKNWKSKPVKFHIQATEVDKWSFDTSYQ